MAAKVHLFTVKGGFYVFMSLMNSRPEASKVLFFGYKDVQIPLLISVWSNGLQQALW
jgi:hypothetical protein